MRFFKIIILLFFILSIPLYASPIINSVSPNFGHNNIKNYLEISGENFDSTCKLYLNPENPFVEFSVKTNIAYDAYVSGKYAYVADRDSGLIIIDLERREIQNTIVTPGNAYSVQISGDFAYVACGEQGLQIVDIVKKQLAGNIDTPGNAYSVQISGDYAYVACGEQGLQIVDIVKKQLAGSIDTPGNAYSVQISGDFAYVACGEQGLQIVDIVKKQLAGSIDTPGNAYSVKIFGDRAYLVDGGIGIQIIDISNLDNPIIDKTISTPTWIYSVFVLNDFLYIGDESSIKILDINSLNLKWNIDISNVVYNMYVLNDYIYIAGLDKGLQVVKMINPDINRTVDTPGIAYDVCVSGNTAYVADGDSGIQIIDITNRKIITNISTPGTAYSIKVANNYAYVACSNAGLVIIDTVNKNITGLIDTPGDAFDVEISGNNVYIADGDAGLVIIDTVNKNIIKNIAMPDTAYSVKVYGDYAYVACNNKGLQIVDLKTYAITSNIDISGESYGVFISGKYAYVASSSAGLQIVDLESHEIIGNVDTPGEVYDVHVAGDIAYLADYDHGIQVIDLSNNIIINNIDIPEYTYNIFVTDDYVFTASDSAGLQILHKNSIGAKSEQINLINSNMLTAYTPVGLLQNKYKVKLINSNKEEFSYSNFTVLNPPILFNASVEPGLGYINTKFIYYVTYKDENNIPPLNEYPKLNINNGNILSMIEVNPDDNNYIDGKLYKYETTNFIKNNYTFKFISPDAIGDTTLFFGPDVNNTKPQVKNLTLTPASPYTTDDLVGAYEYTDADGDTENGTEIKWYKNGVEQIVLQDKFIVPNSATNKGEIWYFSVLPKDGEEFGEEKISASVLIQNTKPEVKIISPLNGSVYNYGVMINFQSQSNDKDIDKLYFIWNSDQDGDFGYNEIININSLSIGTHFITLKAEDGETEVIDTTKIRINGLPEINVVCSSEQGKVPLYIMFKANAYDDNKVEKIYWDFDGNNIIDKESEYDTASFIYTQPGIYKVIVRVKDNDGAETYGYAAISALENYPPFPNIIKSIIPDTTMISISSSKAYDSTSPVYYKIEGEFFNGIEWAKEQGVTDYEFSTTIPDKLIDDNLTKNGLYRYKQIVKDNVSPPNYDTSSWYEVNTLVETPHDNDITFNNITTSGIGLSVKTLSKPSGAGKTGAYFDMVTGADNDRDWADNYTAEYIDLLPNTQYGWKIKYRNYKGIEADYNSTIQKKYTLALVPEKLEVTNITDNGAELKWDKKGASWIRVERAYDSTGPFITLDSTLDSEFYKNSGLEAGTTYWYRVRAYNGDLVITEPSNIVKVATIPGAISNFHHKNNTETSITWEWDDVDGELGYELHDEEEKILGQTEYDFINIIENGLKTNTLYKSRHIHAYNSAGLSAPSFYNDAYTSMEKPNVSFGEITKNSIEVIVSNLINISEGNSGVFFKNATNSNSSGWQRNSNWINNSLNVNTKYGFHVQARNGDLDTTQFSEIFYKYTLCTPPKNLLYSNKTTNSIELHWDKDGASKYAVERANDNNDIPQEWIRIVNWDSGLISASYKDANIDHGKKYWYRVSAYNGDGIISEKSNEIQILMNMPPYVKNLTLTPTFPYTTDDLVGTHEYTDADGDTENGTEIKWYKNGAEQIVFKNKPVVPGSATNKGEIWYFSVLPKDGVEFGEEKISASVLILSNDKPYIPEDTHEEAAYKYLYEVMDKYDSGNALRLLCSYETTSQFNYPSIKNTAFLYDNAIVLLSFLARSTEEDIKRAGVIAQSFIYAQEHDRFYNDGRLRNAYRADKFIDENKKTQPPIWWDNEYKEDEQQTGSFSGQMSWAILALLKYQSYDSTTTIYVSSAKKIGDWIYKNCFDTTGYGGYIHGFRGGEPEQIKDTYKLTEENINVYAAFMQLYYITQDSVWLERASHANKFVMSMWNNMEGYFYPETKDDGITINTELQQLLNTQSNARLVLGSKYDTIFNWCENSLQITEDNFVGFDANQDRDQIWWEGTANMAIAYYIADKHDRYNLFINELEKVQRYAANNNKKGIVSALYSSTGQTYPNAIHTGTTAWYLLAKMKNNPLFTETYEPIDYDFDNDNLPDLWESENKLNPYDSIGINGWNGDPDEDGIINGVEFQNQFDPNSNNSPGAPLAPSLNNIILTNSENEVISYKPILSINNSVYDTTIDFYKNNIKYIFYVYSDSTLINIYDSAYSVKENNNTTNWQLTRALQENNTYWFKALSYIGNIKSTPMSTVKFFVNKINEEPSQVTLSYPQKDSEINVLTMIKLEVNNASDADNDKLTYDFRVYDGSQIISEITGIPEETDGTTQWNIPITLMDNKWYIWECRAKDEHNLCGEWMNKTSFFINTINDIPLIPEVESPTNNSEIATQLPLFVIRNSKDFDNDSIAYFFEIDTTGNFSSSFLQKSGEINEGKNITEWQPDLMLKDNTYWYWRVKSFDGTAYSEWVNAEFFVNTMNDAPSTPVLLSPKETIVKTNTPELFIQSSIDSDNDKLVYEYRIYDTAMNLLNSSIIENIKYEVNTKLVNKNKFFWDVRAIDEHGLNSAWSDIAWFIVNTGNVPPEAPQSYSPSDGSIISIQKLELVVKNAVDPDGDILTYNFQIFDNSLLNGAPIREISNIQEGYNGMTLWLVDISLEDNKSYWWRSQVYDGISYSPWSATSEFTIKIKKDDIIEPNLRSNSKSKKLCIITNSNFIKPNMIIKLQDFRDKVLSRSYLGKKIIEFYYTQ
ncbi:hypothetical protein HZA55_06505 [Candidatus Poribacteria bacterium]|nr:hypothetical protein [Candidatus Poribacteria bacterium]